MSKNSHKAKHLTLGLTAQERRAETRFPFTASVEAVHLQADNRLNGRISDLGRGGCYVDTINPFPVGADVKMRIAKGNASLVAEGRVLYAASGMGMGLAFTRIEPERIVVLESWLQELSGESPRQADTLEVNAAEGRKISPDNEPKYVLNELIVTLIRKRVLTESEGNTLLKRLMQ